MGQNSYLYMHTKGAKGDLPQGKMGTHIRRKGKRREEKIDFTLIELIFQHTTSLMILVHQLIQHNLSTFTFIRLLSCFFTLCLLIGLCWHLPILSQVHQNATWSLHHLWHIRLDESYPKRSEISLIIPINPLTISILKVSSTRPMMQYTSVRLVNQSFYWYNLHSSYVVSY